MVARGWGLPAVVGAHALIIDGTGARTADDRHHLSPGDEVTLDGTTGEIWLGGDPYSAGPESLDVDAYCSGTCRSCCGSRRGAHRSPPETPP